MVIRENDFFYERYLPGRSWYGRLLLLVVYLSLEAPLRLVSFCQCGEGYNQRALFSEFSFSEFDEPQSSPNSCSDTR